MTPGEVVFRQMAAVLAVVRVVMHGRVPDEGTTRKRRMPID